MMTGTEIARFLRERGCPEDMAAGGATGLVTEWERTVEQVRDEYPLGFDDYLNDLDVRQIIEETLRAFPDSFDAPLRQRVAEADRAMRAAVEPIEECVWGEATAEEEGWTAERNWWYFSLPIKRGPLLQEDLEGEE
jgi:hypothetical protein